MLSPLVGKQLESARLATARGNLWEGAVRSSKTVSSIMVWLQYVRTGPPGALLMVGKTERTLKRNILDPIIEMVGKKRCRFVAGSGEVHLFGRTIYVAGANDERAADKIKGLTLAGAYCDEVTTYPESFFAMLGTRLSVEGAQWFGTTNPEGPHHWLKKNYLDRARLHLTRDGRTVTSSDPSALDLNRFSFGLDDNPYLPRAYVESLKLEYTGLFYRRFVLGEWCLAHGSVYDMWDPDRHVIDVLPPIHRWLSLGIDYGTVNPFSAILIGQSEKQLFAVSEYRHDSRASYKQLTDAQYSREVRAWLDGVRQPGGGPIGVYPEWVFVDPSAASFMTQLWSDGLSNVAPAKNAVLDGVRSVSMALGAGLLQVHRSCTGLITEMPGYEWDVKAAERGTDQPLKTNDHSVDALRYGLHSVVHEWRGLIRPGLEAAA